MFLFQVGLGPIYWVALMASIGFGSGVIAAFVIRAYRISAL